MKQDKSKLLNLNNKNLIPFLFDQTIEAGCDEAGRGCLAGPVVAAAVILPKNFNIPFLNDSKKLNEKQRETAKCSIKEQAIAYGIGIINHTEIDQINILNASIKAMHIAIEGLCVKPEMLLIDGHIFETYNKIEYRCIKGGDAKVASIAAASILAKTFRDDLMCQMHEKYPVFDFHKNKGYPSRYHRTQIAKHGLCEIHRKSFCKENKQLSLF